MTLKITGKVDRLTVEINGERIVDLFDQRIGSSGSPTFRKGQPVAYTDPDTGVMYSAHVMDWDSHKDVYEITTNGSRRMAPRSALSELITEYIGVVQVARLIRVMLKQKFPKTKFRVRSSKFTGGTAIDVEWSGAPLTSDVDRLLAMFKSYDIQGGDGMGDPIYQTPRHFVDGKLIVYDVKYLSTQQVEP